VAHQSARELDAARTPGSSALETALLAFLLAWPLLIWAFTHERAPWGDEEHYLATVQLFGRGLSLDLLRSYPEMTAPLTFLVYGAWGHIAGFDTPSLRLLSVCLSWAAASTWWLVLRLECGRTPWTIGALALLVLNPYFVGLSIFVFTDMLALCGLALTALGVSRDRPWLVAAGVGMATLTRQYLVFLVPAVALADMLRRSGRRGRLLTASAAGLLPLAALVVLWGVSLSPDNSLRRDYLFGGLRFDPHALSLYVSLPGLYLLPLMLPRLARTSWRVWALAAPLAATVWLFTIEPSAAQLREGRTTVGFLHKALTASLPPVFVTAVFWAGATCGLAWAISAAPRAWQQWRAARNQPAAGFPWMAAAAFLLVMPFSYLPWEKYALPLLMLVTVMVARVESRRADAA